MNDTVTLFSVRILPGAEFDFKTAIVPLALIVLLLLIVGRYYYRKRTTRSGWKVVEANLHFGGIGEVKLQLDTKARAIAQEIWIELITRKAGLPFDPENDIIVEVYNSWYQLFGEMRRLAKECPLPSGKTSTGAIDLVQLIIKVMNDGLRPHLTQWQGKFRRWYDVQSAQMKEDSPQTIQRQFPEYKALVADLAKVNQGLIEYMDLLKGIAYETPKGFERLTEV